MPTWFGISICCLLIYLCFVVWAQVRFGSYRDALSYLNGSRLRVSPSVEAIGTHLPEETYRTSVTIHNDGGTPVEILGGMADCSCVAHEGLPVTIPPGGSVVTPIVIHFGPKPMSSIKPSRT